MYTHLQHNFLFGLHHVSPAIGPQFTGRPLVRQRSSKVPVPLEKRVQETAIRKEIQKIYPHTGRPFISFIVSVWSESPSWRWFTDDNGALEKRFTRTTEDGTISSAWCNDLPQDFPDQTQKKWRDLLVHQAAGRIGSQAAFSDLERCPLFHIQDVSEGFMVCCFIQTMSYLM